MKRSLIKTAAIFLLWAPAVSVMAHTEVAGYNAMQNAAHNLVHALQTYPWLPFATGVAGLAISFISRMNRRES